MCDMPTMNLEQIKSNRLTARSREFDNIEKQI